jgi:hypothetical protein
VQSSTSVRTKLSWWVPTCGAADRALHDLQAAVRGMAAALATSDS